MMNKEEIEKLIGKLIDEDASLLVGELLRNLELLDGEGLSFTQIKNLYKKLIREKIYQNARYLKKLISINLDQGSIKFRKPKEENPFDNIPDEDITKGI